MAKVMLQVTVFSTVHAGQNQAQATLDY